MKIKKFILTILVLIIIYFITIQFNSQYTSAIENYKNIDGADGNSDPAPYSKVCKNKIDIDPNYFKNSLNSLQSTQPMLTTNDNTPEAGIAGASRARLWNYYECLSKSLGNIEILSKTQVKNEKPLDNPNNINKELASTCQPIKENIIRGENNKLIKFKKIDSINLEIEFNGIEDYYAEYSNEYFNNEFNKISSKKYISTLNSNDMTKKIDEKLLEIYLKIEDKFLKELNLIDALKIKVLTSTSTIRQNFEIIQRFINYYFVNTEKNIYYIDIDLLIYRENKHHGKHINIITSYTNSIIDLINIRVIGIVIDSNIKLYQGNTILNELSKCKSKCKNSISKSSLINNIEYPLNNLTDIEIEKYLENHKKELLDRF
jgi:hypothetical protein